MSELASETPEEAITNEEITGTEVPASSHSNKRNAFTALMESKPKKINTKPTTSQSTVYLGRDGLAAYIQNPTGFPPSRVIYHNPSFVAIHDLYPKSSIHTLLLPRTSHSVLHPFTAFEDREFLSSVKREVATLRSLVAKELRRIYAPYSASERARERVLNGEDDAVHEGGAAAGEVRDLPPGRDWSKDVMCGIHAHPSMRHLHIHVLSVDRYSPYLKSRNHYNSFATPFFVPIDDFPLAEDDVRRFPGRERYLERDFKCWWCGGDFGRSLPKFKVHLEEEFYKWRAE